MRIQPVVRALGVALVAVGAAIPVAQAAAAPTIAVTLQSDPQRVSLEGVSLTKRGGPIFRQDWSPLPSRLGARTSCRLGQFEAIWRYRNGIILSTNLLNSADCDTLDGQTILRVASSRAGTRVVTDRGSFRIGGAVPSSLARRGLRTASAIRFPLVNECTGRRAADRLHISLEGGRAVAVRVSAGPITEGVECVE